MEKNEKETFLGYEFPYPLNLPLFNGEQRTAEQKEYEDSMKTIVFIDEYYTIHEHLQEVEIQWNELFSNEEKKQMILYAIECIETKYFHTQSPCHFLSQSSQPQITPFVQWCYSLLQTYPTYTSFLNQMTELLGSDALFYTIELWKTFIYLQS